MPPSNLQHRRTHNLLLISKLLNQRDVSSPFTLVLDSLEQSAKPLVEEYLRRAGIAKVKAILVSFETLKKPRNVDVLVPAWTLETRKWQAEVSGYLKAEPGQRIATSLTYILSSGELMSRNTGKLLIFDTLNPLASTSAPNLPALLSSFISPASSLLAVYHTDVPIAPSTQDPYAPAPLTLLRYLATTLFTTHSLHHVLVRKCARERSRIEPVFGLDEGVEGVVQGLGANGRDGVVLEMEHRRKSGRGVREWYFLPSIKASLSFVDEIGGRKKEAVILLEDHVEYRGPEKEKGGEASTLVLVPPKPYLCITLTSYLIQDNQAQEGSTFELGLSVRQREDREGVVLPYFDAQKGGGEGGRILYDMGSEDDFDEEEDEI